MVIAKSEFNAGILKYGDFLLNMLDMKGKKNEIFGVCFQWHFFGIFLILFLRFFEKECLSNFSREKTFFLQRIQFFNKFEPQKSPRIIIFWFFSQCEWFSNLLLLGILKNYRELPRL